MPEERSVSDLLAKYRDRAYKAHEEHQADPTEFSAFGELPPGIENGIAQLFEIKVDLYKTGDNKGEPYIHMAGSVIRPEFVGDVKTGGLQTRITHPLCDTPKSKGMTTFDEHYAWVLNEFRKLGVVTEGTSFDDFPQLIAVLNESQPFFRFRTWQGKPTAEYPNPKVNHQWNGACDPPEDFNPDDGAAGTEEVPPEPEPTPPPPPVRKVPAGGAVATGTRQAGQNSGAPGSSASSAVAKKLPTEDSAAQQAQQARVAPNTAPASAKSKPPAGPAKKGSVPKTPPPEPEPQFNEEDLPTLILRATEGDETSQQELVRMAMNAGASEKDIQKCKTWEEVSSLFSPVQPSDVETVEEGPAEEPDAPTEAPAEEAAAEWAPEEGQVYLFRTTDPKTKKPAAKATEFEVIGVDRDAQTVNLRSLEDAKKVHKNVKWTSLEGE